MLARLQKLDIIQRIVFLFIGVVGLFVAGRFAEGAEHGYLLTIPAFLLFMASWLVFFMHFAPRSEKTDEGSSQP